MWVYTCTYTPTCTLYILPYLYSPTCTLYVSQAYIILKENANETNAPRSNCKDVLHTIEIYEERESGTKCCEGYKKKNHRMCMKFFEDQFEYGK